MTDLHAVPPPATAGTRAAAADEPAAPRPAAGGAADHWDVIIIGGGPAGTTVGSKLAQRGRKVLLLEREKFPRFHIGESITAFGFTVFKEMGVYDELAAMNDVKKKGLEFVLWDKNFPVFFYRENRDDPQNWAFQMARSRLDKVLLDQARRNGVDIREEHLVKRVLFQGDEAIGVEYKDYSQGPSDELRYAYAKWIVDASGQGAIINHQLKNNWYNDPLLENKMAVFSHWRGDIEIKNTDDELNFKLCAHRNRRDWAWYIPISKDTVSLGVVLSQQTVKVEAQTKSLEQIFYDYAKDIPYVSELLKNPTLKTVEKFRVVRDYSYRSQHYYGNRWAIVGDSAGFIDPIFSTGLQVAFNSAYALVEPLNTLLDQERPDTSLLKAYDAAVDRYFRVNSMLVYLFYLCKLDYRNYNFNYLWKTIQWAGWSDRMACAVLYLRYIFAPNKSKGKWFNQILFGNPGMENPLGDVAMALSRNYDKVFHDRTLRPPRQEQLVEAQA
ncbi:MAG TPA: NAD(P)/FAD-dependent oxidoreductase [Thermoanaerobaculia bacterium]|jgi:clorobiocin biosynthesis protein Clo-hal|nr:NAD(P)/FAD-dependent oxidoreductase [Thermoanaerobaculia bacterium]